MEFPDEQTTVRIAAVFNYFEAVFWMVFAVLVWVKLSSFNPLQRRNARVASVAFFLFGISDLVETQTGAWWRPVWLLVWKCACVVILLGCWWNHVKKTERR